MCVWFTQAGYAFGQGCPATSKGDRGKEETWKTTTKEFVYQGQKQLSCVATGDTNSQSAHKTKLLHNQSLFYCVKSGKKEEKSDTQKCVPIVLALHHRDDKRDNLLTR